MPEPDAQAIGPAVTVVADDDSEIVAYDFGGQGPPLLLVHATGFHAHTLSQLAGALRLRFHLHAVDLRAHGLSRAAADWQGDWGAFGADLLAVVDRLGLDQPYGFGHSCGGASLLLAEESRPSTFRQLYCYEPVVPAVDEPLPPDIENPMSAGALRRREAFPSKADAEANYAAKAPLSELAPAVLHDYVEYGFETLEDGSVRLRCRRGDEARIYAYGQAHTAYRDLDRVRCPVTLAYGEEAGHFDEALYSDLATRLARSEVVGFAGLGHFGPLEDPERIARAVIQAADSPPA